MLSQEAQEELEPWAAENQVKQLGTHTLPHAIEGSNGVVLYPENKAWPAVFSIKSKPVDLEAKVRRPPGPWPGAVVRARAGVGGSAPGLLGVC